MVEMSANVGICLSDPGNFGCNDGSATLKARRALTQEGGDALLGVNA